jgi:hypothetical protein
VLALGAVIAASWLMLVCLLAERYNIPSGDGILYSLPLALAKHPFDLGIPFLNNFDGYGCWWGHHWPGAMWLRGVIFFALPYSRTADVAVLSLFQLLTAATAAGVVWTATRKLWPVAATVLLILSDRLLLLACAGNRFESIAVAVVLLWFANCVTGLDHRHAGWRWLMRAIALLCPTLHPYGLALGLVILGFDCLGARRQGAVASQEAWVRLAAFALGCLAVAGWFGTQPEALRQFAANLAIQKSFYQNWNAVIAGLGNYRGGGGLVLWGAGLIASGALAVGWRAGATRSQAAIPPALRFLAPALFVTVIAIHAVTRCENFHYLAFGTPFAVIMVGVVAARIAGTRRHRGGLSATSESPSPARRHALVASPTYALALRWLPAVAVWLIVLMHATIIPFRVCQFMRAGCPDLNAGMASVLEGIPANRAVYIPQLLWPAAADDRNHEIRWSTLPLASPRQARQRYEHLAYAKAKPGDVLIVDNTSAAAVDRFGVQPTFPQLPPDPAKWLLLDETKQLFRGAVPWGLDLAIYEFAGPR